MAKEQPQVFSLEAVNALIPRLQPLVATQMLRRTEIESKLRALAALVGETPEELAPPTESDPEPVRALKRELITRITEYQAGWAEVERMGAVLKDARIGLLDFYGRVDGKLVWLCWKYGENEVTHYHALNEGFSARKTIHDSIKQRLLN